MSVMEVMDSGGTGSSGDSGMNPALIAVIANRFDAIGREMSNALLRAGRSALINVARDFSCSICTADDELLSAPEGIPVHIFGSALQTAEMRRLHPDLREGDAFLDNDPYAGNTHHADQAILVPVFVDGEHMFTSVAKAHQADIGNAAPTTYSPFTADIYAEGALNFPMVQVQRDYRDVEDIIRMCRRRIRVPDQWYGDYLAQIGAARTGERRLKELVAKYGKEQVRTFIREWFDYSERRMLSAISELPSGTYTATGGHDAFGDLDRIEIKATIHVDADAGLVEVDLRDNPDCVPAGVNLSQATAINGALSGLLNNLDPSIPHNSGSFRRAKVLLRENCVVGIPTHPTCCSVATTNVSCVVYNITQSSFEAAGPDFGVAEGGSGQGLGFAVISGTDFRTDGPYVNQLQIGVNGGPASAAGDGWVTWVQPCVAGLMYRDSVEIDELKYPLLFESLRLVPDSGGAGRFRGGPCLELVYGTRGAAMTLFWLCDMGDTPAHGIHGGQSGGVSFIYKIAHDGTRTKLPLMGQLTIQPGEKMDGREAGGGGFGDPLDRDPSRVRDDVLKKWVSPEAALSVYGVVVTGDTEDETLGVDEAATAENRAKARQQKALQNAPVDGKAKLRFPRFANLGGN